MNLYSKYILLFTVMLPLTSYADSAQFNYNGVQKGSTSESCYHNPCSIIKVMDFQLLENEHDYSFIRLKVVGGTRNWDYKKIIWNHSFHNLYITCSKENPTVQYGDQVTTIPINPNSSVSGVLYSYTSFYLKICHNFNDDSTEAAKKYGYNVQNW